VYSPNSTNLLLLQEKGDTKVAANYSTAYSIEFLDGAQQKSNGLDFQSAYALGEKMGIKLDGFYKWEANRSIFQEDGTALNKIFYEKRGIEASAGVYNFLQPENSLQASLFAGAGLGRLTLDETVSSSPIANFHRMNYTKFFLQPALTFKAAKGNYAFTLGQQTNLLIFRNVETNLLDYDGLSLINSKPSLFLDFTLHQEFGFEQLKGIRFQQQFGLTILTTKFSDQNSNSGFKMKYHYNDSWFTFGVIADLRKLIQKAK